MTARGGTTRSAALSVADAEATEGEDATLDFLVRLGGNPGSEVTVDYGTRDGTATAGSDYTETSGTLTFEPGEDEQTVSVPITDDDVEDDGETFTLMLSNASGAGFANNDSEATGTIRNTEPTVRPDLTASFAGVPAAHDGESAFTFRVAFSEDIGISFRSLREDAFTVTGGRVTRGRRVDGRRDLFEMTVEPDGAGEVTIELPAGRECGVSGAICTKGENRRQLTNSPSATVAGPPDEAPAGLTATFEDVPAAHDGSAFTFRMAFSEDIGISYRALREDALAVTGGRVTRGARVDDRRDLFEMTVRPESDDDVTITLQAGRECAVSGAICTKGENRRKLTNTITATVAGPPDERTTNRPATGAPTIGGTPQVGEELTASTSGISDADGLDDARFAYQWLRNDTDIQGATAPTYTAVDADAGKRLKVRVSFTDDAGNAENLTSAATDAVATRPEPLTASFSSMPSEHRGDGTFSFRVAFSDEIKISYTTMRDTSFTVTNGDISGARRVDGRRDLWEMTVEPDSDQTVTIRLPETHDCGASGAVCTGDGRPLSHSLSATVAGPVGISVADARVEEAEGALLAFAVTLSRAAVERLTVDYATANGSATAGDDYTAASGTLTFQAGETSKTIEVTVLDDAHDEGEETLTLTLSNTSRGRVTDGEATGTIKNRDPLPRALLARFGRAAAVHVVEHVEERMAAPREPGVEGRFAGRELRRGMEGEVALSFLSQLGASAGAHPLGGGGPLGGSPAGGMGSLGTPGRAAGTPMAAAGGLNGNGLLQMGLGGGDVLTGSAFAMNRETRHGGILSFWSRGARSSFSGREGALSLGGDVRTTMVGADYAKGPLVAGLSLSHSRGLGEYAGVAGGQVASSVTGLYPWLGYKATDRITVWGVAGYGAGGLRLTPQGGPALEAGLSMAMAAAGTRGELVAGRRGRLRAGVQGRRAVGRHGDRRRRRPGGAPGGDRGGGDPVPDRPGGLARLHARGPAVAQAERRGGAAARRRRRRDRRRHGRRRGSRRVGCGDGAGGGRAGADAAGAPGRRVLASGAWPCRSATTRRRQTPLGLDGAGGAVVGRCRRQSGAEALWGRETMAGMAHGGLAAGQPVRRARSATGCRWGARLRGDAAGRLQHVGVRPGLPGRLRPDAWLRPGEP